MSESITLHPATPADFAGIWPFFRQILAEGETYAYPRDLGEEAARELWFSPDRRVFVAQSKPVEARAPPFGEELYRRVG